MLFQVEYYFSDENLPSDKFLLKQVKKDKEGFGKFFNWWWPLLLFLQPDADIDMR